jgi:hypothetical protein
LRFTSSSRLNPSPNPEHFVVSHRGAGNSGDRHKGMR